MADEYVELLRRWDRDLRGRRGARIRAYPAATPTTDLLAGRIIDKRHVRIVVSWSETRET